jgi:hypothetical protein
MNPKWHFNTQRLCDRTRDPNNDAFFTAESLDNLSEALVREGIQNSLDAAKRDAANVRQVRVRIRYEKTATAEVRDYMAKMFGSAQRNFEHGLPCPSIERLFGKDCGYLLFEDFGTKGLVGDVSECRFENAAQNAFFSFFRAEGLSSKSLGSLGRWGIGKQVFPTHLKQVERHVSQWLSSKIGVSLNARRVIVGLRTDGTPVHFEFNGVSDDGAIGVLVSTSHTVKPGAFLGKGAKKSIAVREGCARRSKQRRIRNFRVELWRI